MYPASPFVSARVRSLVYARTALCVWCHVLVLPCFPCPPPGSIRSYDRFRRHSPLFHPSHPYVLSPCPPHTTHTYLQSDENKLRTRTGAIHNSLAAGVIEPAMSKCKSISFATEAAITILRIDDMIKIAKKEEQG